MNVIPKFSAHPVCTVVICAAIILMLVRCDQPQTTARSAPSLGFETVRRVYGSGEDRRDVVDLDAALQFRDGEDSAFVESANKGVGDEFIHAFRVVPECNGITFIADDAKPVDFTVSLHVGGRLQHPAAQSWIYVVTNLKTHERDFMNKYREAKFDAQTTAKDVCMKVWDRVDPNRIPGAGGKVR